MIGLELVNCIDLHMRSFFGVEASRFRWMRSRLGSPVGLVPRVHSAFQLHHPSEDVTLHTKSLSYIFLFLLTFCFLDLRKTLQDI